MPREAPVFKVEAVQRLGARVTLAGESVDDALALARERASEPAPGGGDGPALVHPFDDLDVIAGQGTDRTGAAPGRARGGPRRGPDRRGRPGERDRRRPAPGGGARRAGRGAGERLCPLCPPAGRGGRRARAGRLGGATIADGIAIKHPGEPTQPLLEELLDGWSRSRRTRSPSAIVLLAERAKLVAEGAGAVSLAAVRAAGWHLSAGLTVAIVSGGNLDSGLLSAILRRRETEQGRRVRLFTRVADRPGALAELLALVADAGGESAGARAPARGDSPARTGDRRRADARDPRARPHA